ncbi:class I SAM-dependent methyltransferase [Actinophytocola sp.]|uniref:class I SAM-dependent methyltransferase n=1 Tax=Actinophytocola sp. TaxID=1872138 RepID=UPI002D80FB50|nr:class I SAM-dependent methyltransferase [Actinophytocola sp.]HET9144253.1 class I SAM-dependent methyltransferase [Actinophytocola sp.]
MRYDTEVVEPLHADLFGPLHARYFDIFHRRKDYRAEVDQLTATAGVRPAGSVLDLGCGTGRHLELLAAAGYEVVGVDRSAAMARRAGTRLARFGQRASVVEGDLFDVTFDRRFDLVIMMYSLLGYFVTSARVIEALAAMARQVAPDGLVVFDVEDAAAVLRAPTPLSGGSLLRDGPLPLLFGHNTSVNEREQVIEIVMHMWQIDGARVLDHVEETHLIRYFSRPELRLLLERAGLELVGYEPLSGDANNPSQPWLRLVSARKR